MRGWLIERRQQVLADDIVDAAAIRRAIEAHDEVRRGLAVEDPEITCIVIVDELDVRPAEIRLVPGGVQVASAEVGKAEAAPMRCGECHAAVKNDAGLAIHKARAHGVGGERRKWGPTRRQAERAASNAGEDEQGAGGRRGAGQVGAGEVGRGTEAGELTSDPAAAEAASGTPCPDCDRTFFDVEALRVHAGQAHRPARAASDRSAVTCIECERTFASPGRLSAHRTYKHPEPDDAHAPRPLACPECGRTFNTPTALGVHHRRTHLGERARREAGL